MDVISISKAKRALEQIKDLDQNVVAPKAEGRFATVDARLDWLEGQASKLISENSYQVDLSSGIFNNVELVDKNIQLKHSGIITTNESRIFSNKISGQIKGTFQRQHNLEFNEILNADNSYITFKFVNSSSTVPTFYVSVNGITVGSWTAPSLGGSYTNTVKLPSSLEGQKDLIVRMWNTRNYAAGYEYELDLMVYTNKDYYVSNGSWISPIIDLGEEWNHTKIIDIVKQINMETTGCIIEISFSQDGKTFSEYMIFDPNSIPQARYLRFRAELIAETINIEDGFVRFNFNQFNPHNIIALNEFVEANGQLKLKNNIAYTMSQDNTWNNEGLLFRRMVDKRQFKFINSISVK